MNWGFDTPLLTLSLLELCDTNCLNLLKTELTDNLSILRAPCVYASVSAPGVLIRLLHVRGARMAFQRRGDSSFRGTNLRAAFSFSAHEVPGLHCFHGLLRTNDYPLKPTKRCIATALIN